MRILHLAVALALLAGCKTADHDEMAARFDPSTGNLRAPVAPSSPTMERYQQEVEASHQARREADEARRADYLATHADLSAN
jgi:hypothetical protein